MTWCSQLEDIEALVLGELAPERAAEVRGHAAHCRACSQELALVLQERALFARRAAAIAEPPAAVAFAVRRQMRESAEAAPPRAARLVPLALRFVLRGHVSAACVAALFTVAALSRVGAPAPSETTSPGAARTGRTADELGDGAGLLASITSLASTVSDEPLACSSGSQASRVSRDEDVASLLSAPASASAGASSFAALREDLACGASSGRAPSSASCEPFVTCSSLLE